MKKLFFENSESKFHYQMKEKLFDLIISGKVNIKDQNGEEFQIFKKTNKDEFLHIESFVFKPKDESTYINTPMFSNNELPCVKYLNFNMQEHKLLCDLKGSCGAFEKLPCRKCMEINLSDKEKSDISIGFAPDIAFGYEGKHILWLEILNTSACSEYKITYCKSNNIKLLEISVSDIDKYIKGDLIFNNLTDNKELEKQKIMNEEIHICHLLDSINKYGYLLMRDFKDRYREILLPIHSSDFNKIYNELLEDHEFYEIGQHDYNEYVKKFLNIKINGTVHLIVNKSFKEKIEELVDYSKLLTYEEIMDIVEWIVQCTIEEIDHHNYVRQKDFYNRVLKELRRAKLTNREYKEIWETILQDNNLIEEIVPQKYHDCTIVKRVDIPK